MSEADLQGWLATLAAEGLLPAGPAPTATEFTAALYGYLTRTPAMLIGVSLADATGERRPQNMPGTTDQYPNWRIPLGNSEGEPVLLEDLPAHAGLASVISRIRSSR
jgi:4-alpha-glucanotransferase